MKHVKIADGAPLESGAPELRAADVAFNGRPALADWAHFSDPLTGGERVIQALSRAAGIITFSGCAGVALFALARLF
ncbi:hypothetical protein [Sphingobium mellinum]|uniref:hypothetical protein n=1 Tax=Sphingobium mellinum TaxID=1387166 RepID=UPI0030EEA331